MVTQHSIFFHISLREFHAGSFLQNWSSKKKRATSEVGPAVQLGPRQLCVLSEYQRAGALKPVSPVSWDPPRSERHNQDRRDET